MKKIGMLSVGIVFLMIALIGVVSAGTINVCPSCNFTTIQAAINNATNGDVINVSAGSYNEDLIVNKSIELIGHNATIKGIANVNQIDWPLAAPNIEILEDNVKIHGFTIESPDYASLKYTSGIVIGRKDIEIYNNNLIINSAGSLDEISQIIQTYSSSAMPGVDISGLNIHDNNFNHKGNNSWGYEAIYVNPDNESSTVFIKNNNFNGKVLRAITSERSNTVIENNRIITEIPIIPDDLSAPGAYQGINILAQSQVKIKNNTIEGFNQGIRLGKIGQILSDFEVENNIIKNNKKGILVRSANGIKINNNDIFGNSAYGLINEDSNVVNAENNYWGACDGPSTVGTGNGDNVSANVTYIPFIGACVTNTSSSKNCSFTSDSITLYANLSGSCIGDVIFSVESNGSVKNYSGIKTGDNAYVSVSNFTEGMNANWKVYVDDCYSHLSESALNSIYILKKTKLNILPSSPDGIDGWYISQPLFNLTNSDATLIHYKWDSNGIFDLSSGGSFGLENTPNDGNVTGGALRLTYWADTTCGTEPEQNKSFKFDLSNPIIEIISPLEDSTVNTKKPEVKASITDLYGTNSGINESSVYLRVNGNLTNFSYSRAGRFFYIKHIPKTELAEGKNNISIYVEDNSGRHNQVSWSFFVNTSVPPFELIVNSPKDGESDSRKTYINVSTAIVVDSISYINLNDKIPRYKTLCTNCKEYGTKSKKFISLLEGNNTITIKAVKNSKEETENINVFVDSKKPKIMSILPKRGSVTNGSRFYIKYFEDNLKSIILFYGDGEKITKTDCASGKSECTFSIDPGNIGFYEGEYIDYWFLVNDSINGVESQKTRIKVDTTAPVLIVSEPLEGNTYSRRALINVDSSEDSLIQYKDSSELNSRWKTLCTRCTSYKRNKSFTEGSHDLLIRAVDSAGNSDVKEVNFVIN